MKGVKQAAALLLIASGALAGPPITLTLESVIIDGVPNPPPAAGQPLRLPPGLHRLDFRLRHTAPGPVKLRCQLGGFDDRWAYPGRGMTLECLFYNAAKEPLSRTQFDAPGRSRGWNTSLENSSLTPRREPLLVPEGTHSLRISLSSGDPDVTGIMAVDNVTVNLPDAGPGSRDNIWLNAGLSTGTDVGLPGGTPAGWRRTGGAPAIAGMAMQSSGPLLTLTDHDGSNSGGWTALQTPDPPLQAGRVVTLSWDEAYDVVDGFQHTASYFNVASGSYIFRAVCIPNEGPSEGASTSLDVIVRPALTDQPWFAPAAAGLGVTALAGLVFLAWRRHAAQKVERLNLQNALERDRTRIAQDMHDDLGTRLTRLTLSASLVSRDLETDPARARQHLDKMSATATDMIRAMDELVWAVDPANDTLDHLGDYLTQAAETIFRDSPVRCLLDIPPVLPSIPLGAEVRHHLFLAVNEALHNALQHAGPCVVTLSLRLDPGALVITITDTGSGFDPATVRRGNGLLNLEKRLISIGGKCELQHPAGGGTQVTLTLPLPD